MFAAFLWLSCTPDNGLFNPDMGHAKKKKDDEKARFAGQKFITIPLKALIKILEKHVSRRKRTGWKARIRHKHIFLFYLFAMDIVWVEAAFRNLCKRGPFVLV